MPVNYDGTPAEGAPETTIRAAAAGDIHCSEHNRDAIVAAFAEIDRAVDLILLAGDLTTHGEPEQAAVLGDACRAIETPVFAVLGNHDHHAGRAAERAAVREEAGVTVLDPGHSSCEVRGHEVGIVGAKGFIGGFPGSHLSDFGEPSLRALYTETQAETQAIDEGLRAVALCPFRIVVLHYAPTSETLQGEPVGIWTYLGTDRLAPPIVEHSPDLVVHGHAHAGRFRGEIGDVPVFNVSVPVIGRDFWVFELTGSERSTPIH